MVSSCPGPSSGPRALAGMAAVNGRPRTPGAAATGTFGPARCLPPSPGQGLRPLVSTVTIGAAASTAGPRRRLDDAVAARKNKTHTTLRLGPALVVARPDLVRRPRQAQMHVARREDRALGVHKHALGRQRRMRPW